MGMVQQIAENLASQFEISCPHMKEALSKLISADEASGGKTGDPHRETAMRELYGYGDHNLSAGADLYLTYRDSYWGL